MQLRGVFSSPFIAKIALAIYLAMLIFLVGFGFFILTYVLFLVAFIFLVLNLEHFKSFHWLSKRPLVQKILFIFLIALFLRFLLLFQEQIVTRDIVLYVLRSERMMAGRIPYEEFAINKPPMYAYLLQGLGLGLGAGEIQFRAFFSIMDSLLAVIIYYLFLQKLDEKFSFIASFAYVLCPLPLLAVGLAGHYEPVVMIFVLLSIICLFKEKFHLSAFLLGIGFAFKFFPLVLLPFFAWKVEGWKNRILYFLAFSIPMILSIIPIILISPDAFWSYMYMQSYSWPAKKSFAFAFEMLLGSKAFFGIKYTFLFTLIFLGLIFLMFLTWIKKRFDAALWFKIIVICYLMYYGLFSVAAISFYGLHLGNGDTTAAMAIFSIIYFPIVFALLNHYWHRFRFKLEAGNELFILSAFSLIFLLFSSSQYNPWYILWFLPFILGIKTGKVRFALLWLIFWSFEGIGISLLPGFAIG